MLLLVAPTAVPGIHVVADVACMCPAEADNVVAAEVVVPPDMNCSPAVGTATAVVVDVVAIVSVSVSAVFAGAVVVWVDMLSALYDAAPSTPLVCPVQTCPSPSVLSLSTHSCACSIRKRFLLRAHA